MPVPEYRQLVSELRPPAWPAGMKQERLADGVKLNDVAAKAVHEHLEWDERVPDLAVTLVMSHVDEATKVQAAQHQVDMAQQAAKIDKLEQNQATTMWRLKLFGEGIAVGLVAAAVYGVLHK